MESQCESDSKHIIYYKEMSLFCRRLEKDKKSLLCSSKHRLHNYQLLVKGIISKQKNSHPKPSLPSLQMPERLCLVAAEFNLFPQKINLQAFFSCYIRASTLLVVVVCSCNIWIFLLYIQRLKKHKLFTCLYLLPKPIQWNTPFQATLNYVW